MNEKMKEKIIPIASVAIGLVAFFLSLQFLSSREAELKAEYAKLTAGLQKVSVLASARDMVAGSKLTAADLGRMSVFKRGLPRDYISPDDFELVLNSELVLGVDANQVLCWSDLKGGAPAATGLSASLTPGLRAISISVGGAAAVSGLVRPNDRVDVLGTFSFPSKSTPGEMETVTLTVLQDVSVLATGQTLANNYDQQSRRSSGYSMVTLAVSIREAELLTFAQHTNGRLTLALRHPTDNNAEPSMPAVNFDYLQNKLPELNKTRQETIRMKRPGAWSRSR
jgi:pilus assembly protein CpaB